MEEDLVRCIQGESAELVYELRLNWRHLGEINYEESYNYGSASQLYCKSGNFVACILAIVRFLSRAIIGPRIASRQAVRRLETDPTISRRLESDLNRDAPIRYGTRPTRVSLAKLLR